MPTGFNEFTQFNPYIRGAATSTASGVNSPQSGVMNPFGGVPAPIPMPNPAGDVGAQYPNLPGTNAALSSDIYAKLNGYLSPSTTNAIQNHFGGTFGVKNGMPGSGLGWNNVYGNIIGAAENQRQQGIQDYNATLPTISGTQTVNPAIQTAVNDRNSVYAAAPNPQMAQSYARNLFDQYLQQMRGPAGGTGQRAANPGADFSGLFGDSNEGAGALGFGFGSLGPSSGTGSFANRGSSSAIGLPGDYEAMGWGDTPTVNTSYDPTSGELPASALDNYDYFA